MKFVEITLPADPAGDITLDEAIAAGAGQPSPITYRKGAGVAVNAPEGVRILTCQHVVGQVGDVVQVEGYDARVLAVSDVGEEGEIPLDLALLSVPAELEGKLTPVDIHRSIRPLDPWQRLYVVRPGDRRQPTRAHGYPAGLGFFRIESPPGYAQGWSGSPVENEEGVLVGICFLIFESANLAGVIGPEALIPFVLGRTPQDPDGLEIDDPKVLDLVTDLDQVETGRTPSPETTED